MGHSRRSLVRRAYTGTVEHFLLLFFPPGYTHLRSAAFGPLVPTARPTRSSTHVWRHAVNARKCPGWNAEPRERTNLDGSLPPSPPLQTEKRDSPEFDPGGPKIFLGQPFGVWSSLGQTRFGDHGSLDGPGCPRRGRAPWAFARLRIRYGPLFTASPSPAVWGSGHLKYLSPLYNCGGIPI